MATEQRILAMGGVSLRSSSTDWPMLQYLLDLTGQARPKICFLATASGENLVFAATGVTPGDLLEGVRFFGGGARTHSLVMAYQTKTVRFVDTVHMFERDSPPRVRL